jgi:hypothetical protein
MAEFWPMSKRPAADIAQFVMVSVRGCHRDKRRNPTIAQSGTDAAKRFKKAESPAFIGVENFPTGRDDLSRCIGTAGGGTIPEVPIPIGRQMKSLGVGPPPADWGSSSETVLSSDKN